MLPKLTHIAAILPNLPRQKIDEIEKICKKFLKLNKRPIVDSTKTLYATNNKNGLNLTRISEFWTALKITWLKRYTSSRSFWVTLKNEWLSDLSYTNLDPRNTNSIEVDVICKKCPNLFWKSVYKSFRMCVNNFVRMFPEEFI